MNTTLNQLHKYRPCKLGWDNLLLTLNKTKADDELLSFKFILESNGIKDAVWCLRVLDFRTQCLFCADVAELVLPIFEKHYPTTGISLETVEAIRAFHQREIDENCFSLPRETVEAVRAFHRGEVNEECLRKASRKANNFYYTIATDPYASAACVAAEAPYAHLGSAYTTVYCAIIASRGYRSSKEGKEKAEADARERVKSIWKDIEKLFIRHFT